MEEQNVVKQIIDYKEEEIFQLDEILSNLEKYDITSISISKDTLVRTNNGIVKFIRTDYNHPLRIEEDIWLCGNSLEINEEYFIKNQSQVINLIREICRKNKNEKISIRDSVLITDEILNDIIGNNNIKETAFTEYENNPEYQFELTPEIYQKFKTANKVITTQKISPDLENNFDSTIGYNAKKHLIGYSTYANLQDINQSLYIAKELTEEEIENLKYIIPTKKITINIDNYENMEKILNRIIDLKITPEVTIKIKDKEKFNETSIFKDNKYEELNIYVNNNLQTNSLHNYKNFENILYTFIKPAIEKNYSPFEKYIYAYNISKKFKKYREVEENQDTSESRNLYNILINEYMVCVGYGNLFRDLLSKLDIPAVKKGIEVSTNVPTEDVEFAGHDRTFVHIQDPKYNIDGFYIADPTWDNNLEHDLYAYLAVTSKEMNNNARLQRTIIKSQYKSLIDDNILFDFKNLNDFYQRVNYIINEKLNQYITECKTKKEVIEIKKQLSTIYLKIIITILDIVKKLDEQTYISIMSKYNIPDNAYSRDAINFYDIYPQIITELGTYLDSKINNKIDGKTIVDAAMVINKDIFNFTEEQEIEYRNYLIDINSKYQALDFPKREIENATTEEIIYENNKNKFDIPEYQQASGKHK